MSQHPLFADDMQEIVESFVVETREVFETLDRDLLLLEETPGDRALVDRIFRAVHTVKGTSGFLSLEQMSGLTHHFEDVLNRLRRGELDFQPGMMDVMLSAFDLMKVLLQQVVDKTLEPVEIEILCDRLQSIAQGSYEALPATTEKPVTPDPETAPAAVEEDWEAEIQAEFARMNAALALERATVLVLPDAVQDTPALPAAHQTPAPAQPAGADDAGGAKKPGPARKADQNTETIRVEVSRLDNLMNLVGELVLGRNRLLQIVEDLGAAGTADTLRELGDTSAQVDFITTELQAAIMRTRMVQIGRVFNKFPRVVRDLAKEFNKQIELVIEGEETELDKTLIEEISDPLVHLIRNACDHGIQMPEVRAAAGKPPMGRVRLSASHEGNHIVIVAEDDGAGLDPARLKKAAIEKKLITPKEAAEMTESEAFALIFRAGFSTASKISQVSGRGVGMDVVKTNITKLNGTIGIESAPGEGTRFILKLPLTLAIIQSLLVRVRNESYAIPLHSVVEVVALEENVSTINGREVIRLRDQILPLLRISDVLDVSGPPATHEYAVVLALGHQKLGLIVDALVGQKEIVIKGLGDYLQKVPGIAGSTIIGDGSVIMILDVGELIRMGSEQRRSEKLRSGASA